MDLDCFVTDADRCILDAISQIEYSKVRATLIRDNGKIIGLLSEGDILRLILKKISLYANVRDYVRTDFIYLLSKDLKQAKKIFKEKNIIFIPVLDKDFKLQDVIMIEDVID